MAGTMCKLSGAHRQRGTEWFQCRSSCAYFGRWGEAGAERAVAVYNGSGSAVDAVWCGGPSPVSLARHLLWPGFDGASLLNTIIA